MALHAARSARALPLRGRPLPRPHHPAHAGGLYPGRIILPAQSPLRPPSFRFVTPTGRFEVNREICLSISGHHEETWQPAWGIRTALVAIRSFMDTDAKGQVGGIDSTEVARRKMAAESGAFRCAACGGRSNAEIMREREELAREAEGEGKQEEEAVPEELRLAYREDLAKEDGEGEKAQASSSAAAAEKTGGDSDAPMLSAATPPRTEPVAAAPPTQAPTTTTTTTAAAAPAPPRAAAPGAPAVPTPTRTVPAAAAAPALRQQQRPLDDGVPAWIDKAIYGVLGALAFMILRKFF
ncbi:putative ubiquitin-conjugating enzyme e2 j1 protein [Lasiodiplodia theobromae]|uniref:Ubiquitin-conjugating enzyme e2 j1 protein n=1 Tax=Lasiodiplodia theobromae TaxID=45133 RepID=A0A8H7IRE6_9PEZI|nr:putative ubiquitin-conjugating enzyme e2 j1 protein [Lasiodiplodia theobromae]